MSRLGVVLVSFCLISQFYGGLGQDQYHYQGYGNEGIAQSPGFRPLINAAARHSRISCKENAINYNCLFRDVHISDTETVSLSRFADYEQPYATNYTSLAFVDSSIRRLPVDLLRVYPNTELLNLQDLQLRVIDRDAFMHGAHVQKLFLSFNSLSQLERGVFNTLPALDAIHMNRNHLSLLPEGLFDYNEMLVSVSITHNDLKRIEDSTFTYNPHLESVNVSSNSIEHFELSLLTAAIEIDVSYNRLKQIKIPARLENLFASHNHIDHVTPNGQNRELKVLDLSNNKLTTVSWASKYPELEELDLGHNEIEDVKHNHLPTQKLKKLLLNNNRLFSFDVSKATNIQLQVLDLSYNQLTYVESSSKKFDRLQQLYLHNNAIVKLELPAKNMLQNISLSNNDWDCANLIAQLDLIDPSAILDDNESSCQQGYITERRLCCKQTAKAYLDRLLVEIRQRNVFELAKRIQCDDYQNAVVDIDKLNAALATAPVQSPETLRTEVNALTSAVTSLTAEKDSNEQLLNTLNQNLLYSLDRYGVEYVGFDTPRMMADKLMTKLESRDRVRKTQTVEQWESTNLKNAEREELKSLAGQLEIVLSNKKAAITNVKQETAKIMQEVKKLQARLNANARSSQIYAKTAK
ncbi:carboxypeptidase N subunit 2-like [Anopheles darlingi]|uniref:carboxypeptidase N subunit 2-like n=1 Tax=Anopheles darlingi TaxID=43151 RepID=UPI0021005304|nr:carboxypeptidase N subunit 2-like [Anopheles darlingi]